jgi:cation transport ATPase
VALAAHGGGIAAEAADVVLLHENPGRLVEAIRISRRTLRVARESVLVGLGLSGAAMLIAAMGHLSPVTGALTQEGIDLVVILNALRAAKGSTTTI